MRLKLSKARSTLDEWPAAVEKAKQLLEEGEKLINECQKHIRIADRFDNGWATLEYVEDELADNEDHEKHLLRADARAGKKLKSAQRGGRGSARKNFPRRNPWNFQGPRNIPGSTAAGAIQFIPQPANNMYPAVAMAMSQQHSFNS